MFVLIAKAQVSSCEEHTKALKQSFGLYCVVTNHVVINKYYNIILLLYKVEEKMYFVKFNARQGPTGGPYTLLAMADE